MFYPGTVYAASRSYFKKSDFYLISVIIKNRQVLIYEI